MQKLIEIKDVIAGYGSKTVLRDVSLDIYEGDFLGIIGPNGGGKTTLLKVILGLLQPSSGTIRFYQGSQQVPFLRIGYLPQLNNIDKKFPITVRDVIASGLASEKRWIRGFNDQQNKRIDTVVTEMGLENLVKRPIGELSGGQLQRVLFDFSCCGFRCTSYITVHYDISHISSINRNFSSTIIRPSDFYHTI